jgi:ClpP class serine protease
MVDRTYSAFRRHVRLARKLSDEEVRNAAQGKVWAGAEAKDLKLIDGQVLSALIVFSRTFNILFIDTLN